MTKPTKITAWQDSSGALHTCIEAWQQAEMLTVLNETDGSAMVSAEHLKMLANDLVGSQRDAVLAILTTGPRTRAKARKAAGTTNPRRAARTQAKLATGVNEARNGDVAAEPVEASTN
jgi:hypothetical protein